VLPWIVLDLLQWKTQCLFTYIRSGFVNHYFSVESQKLYLSRPGFVNVQNWKNSIKKLNITIMFPFYNLFKVHYNTCQGCVRLATTAYSQNILHVDARCIILKERNTKRFVQNWHSPMSPSTEWSWFFIELVMFSLFAMQLDYCDIQRVFDQK
jgi:hypothetical protein